MVRWLATSWTYFLHLSLSSVILIDSSTGSPVYILMLSIQTVLHTNHNTCAPQCNECILCYTILQLTTGTIANFQHEFINFGIFADGPL